MSFQRVVTSVLLWISDCRWGNWDLEKGLGGYFCCHFKRRKELTRVWWSDSCGTRNCLCVHPAQEAGCPADGWKHPWGSTRRVREWAFGYLFVAHPPWWYKVSFLNLEEEVSGSGFPYVVSECSHCWTRSCKVPSLSSPLWLTHKVSFVPKPSIPGALSFVTQCL